MSRLSKILFFLLILLPVLAVLLVFFFFPLIIVLLCLIPFWTGKIITFHFRKQPDGGSDGYNDGNDFVDVESTVIDSRPCDGEEPSSGKTEIPVLPASDPSESSAGEK